MSGRFNRQALREYFKKAGGSMLEIYDRWEREMAAYSTTVRCEVCQRTTHLVSVDRGCDDRYEAGDLTACCYSEDFVVLRDDDDDEDDALEECDWDPAYHGDSVVAIGYGYRIAQDGPVFRLPRPTSLGEVWEKTRNLDRFSIVNLATGHEILRKGW